MKKAGFVLLLLICCNFNLLAYDDIEMTLSNFRLDGKSINSPHTYANLWVEVKAVNQDGTYTTLFDKWIKNNHGNSFSNRALNETNKLMVDVNTVVEFTVYERQSFGSRDKVQINHQPIYLRQFGPDTKKSFSFTTKKPVFGNPEGDFTLDFNVSYQYKKVKYFTVKAFNYRNEPLATEALCPDDILEIDADVSANKSGVSYGLFISFSDGSTQISVPDVNGYWKGKVSDLIDLLPSQQITKATEIYFSAFASVNSIRTATNFEPNEGSRKFRPGTFNPSSTTLAIDGASQLACIGDKINIKVKPQNMGNYDLFISANENFEDGEISTHRKEELTGLLWKDVSIDSGTWYLTVSLKNTENENVGRCYTTSSVTINQYPTPEAVIASSTDPTCEKGTNGQITMQPSPGKAPIMYDNGAGFKEDNNFSNLQAGTYKIKVKDACGIEVETDTTLIAPQNVPKPTFEDLDNSTCLANPNGNFIAKIDHPNDANFSYNYKYVLYKNNDEFKTVDTSDKQVPFNNLAGANYKVVIHDADRPTCPTAENFTILDSIPSIQLNVDDTQNPTCFNAKDGYIESSATGGVNTYQFFINNTLTDPPGNGDFLNLKAGKYEVYAKTTVGNCPDQSPVEEIELINPPEIKVSLNTVPMQCNNDNDASIAADVTGGNGNFSYQWYFKSGSDWFPASTAASYQNLQSGEYKLEVSEASCTIESAVVQIINPQPLTFATVDINRPACKGDQPASINPSASGGWGDYQYFTALNQPGNWQSFTLGSTIGDGTYYLQVEDKEGCTHIYENTIQFITPEEELVMDLATQTQNGYHLTCFNSNDGSVSINGNGGVGSYLYAINNQDFISESSFDQLPAGKHIFKLKDENGCEKTSELTLTQPTQINLSILSQDDVKCFGEYSGTAELTANGGITPYQFRLDENDWQEQPVFDELTAQSYLVTVKDANECEVILPLEIQSIFDPIVIDFDVNHASCFGYSDGSINTTLAGGMPPFSYQWQQGSDEAFLQELPAGTYELEVADDEGCKATASVTITEPENIDLGDPVTICQQQDYPLDVSQPDATAYQWSGPGDFSSDQPLVNFTEAGTYQLTLTLENGCEMTDDFVLNYNDILFETNFLIASAAEVGDTVRLIEVCYPAPDSVNWRMDARANILQMDKHRPLISFDQPGEYPIAMAASYSGCVDSLTKTVRFYELGEMPAQGARMKLGIAGIRAIQVYPNPNQGAFTLELHLYQPDDVMFFLYDLSGNEITRIKRGGEVRYEEPVALGSYRPGIYILKAVAAGDEKNIRIMIN